MPVNSSLRCSYIVSITRLPVPMQVSGSVRQCKCYYDIYTYIGPQWSLTWISRCSQCKQCSCDTKMHVNSVLTFRQHLTCKSWNGSNNPPPCARSEYITVHMQHIWKWRACLKWPIAKYYDLLAEKSYKVQMELEKRKISPLHNSLNSRL